MHASCERVSNDNYKLFNKLGTQIEARSQANTALERHFNDLLKTRSETLKILKPSEVSTAATALSIADKLSERERKEINIMVYNFPEASEESPENQNFANLCKAIVKVNINIQKMFHIHI